MREQHNSIPFGWTLSSFYAFYFAILGAIVPYMSLYLESIGFTPSQIGVLMSTLLITKIIAPNFWGLILDKQSLKHPSLQTKTVTFALSICCLMFLWLNFTEHFWLIAALMFAYSFFWNAVLPQMETIVYNYLGEKRHLYGKIRVWGSIGFIISVTCLGWLIDNYGINILLPFVTTVFAALALHGLFIGKSSASNLPTLDSCAASNKFLHLFTPTIVMVLVLGAIGQMTHAPFYTFFSIYLESYGYSKTLIGWLWALGVIAEVGVFLFAHHLLTKFDIFKLLLMCFAVTAIRWWMLSKFPDSLTLLILTQTLHAMSFGLYHSTSSQLINAQFKGQYQVRGQALYSSITFGVGGSIGTLASGYLWSAYDGQTVFMLCAILMGIATAIGVIFATFLRA